jgi:hypothetical protein
MALESIVRHRLKRCAHILLPVIGKELGTHPAHFSPLPRRS